MLVFEGDYFCKTNQVPAKKEHRHRYYCSYNKNAVSNLMVLRVEISKEVNNKFISLSSKI